MPLRFLFACMGVIAYGSKKQECTLALGQMRIPIKMSQHNENYSKLSKHNIEGGKVPICCSLKV